MIDLRALISIKQTLEQSLMLGKIIGLHRCKPKDELDNILIQTTRFNLSKHQVYLVKQEVSKSNRETVSWVKPGFRIPPEN